jgi:hypothetical protein
MKIFKISQNAEIIENQEETIQVIQNLTAALNNLNESLKVIENSNIQNLLNRNQIASNIQTSNFLTIGQGQEETVSTAVHNIAISIPIIQQSEQFLQNSKINYEAIKQGMVEILQSNSWNTYNSAIVFVNSINNVNK